MEVEEVVYNREDLKRLSWKEYDRALQNLHKQTGQYLKKHNLTVDAIVPIFRAGAIPATYLAYKLRVLRILPLQYKYFFSKDHKINLKKLYEFQKSYVANKSPIFLLVENNHCFGTTAKLAAKQLKTMFPKCRILYAAAHADYKHRAIPYAEASFYGRFTNESKALNIEECRRKKIKNGVFVFPWENIEEEWESVKCEPYKYQDKPGSF